MAPLSTTSKPSQYKQSSRKGKKAWRKNIDLTDIEKSLESKRDLEITHGKADLASVEDEALFAVDTDGDNVLKQKLIKRKQIKKNLKSTEILESIKTNSKVSVLKHPKVISNNEKSKKKVQGVSKKEITRLMAMAGKVHGESGSKTKLAKDGLVKSGSNDLWGDEKPSKKKKKIQLPSGIKLDVSSKKEIPKELLTQSTTSWSLPSVKPKTLDIEPVKVKEYKELPHSGKSYNPNRSDWSALLDKEYKEEKVREDRRIAVQEYRERIKELMSKLDDNEEDSSDDDEEEEETSKTPEDEEELTSLSVNNPVENKKKTKYQRNKMKRHQEKVRLQRELKLLRSQVKGLENLEEIEEEVVIDHQLKETLKGEAAKVAKPNKKHKLGTKFTVMEENLEVKFSDELSDSLRKLKPESHLLYDTVRKLQSSGKIESRIPVKRGRRYKQKITEKWTYKDFK
ncbi:hypothetical protein Kpol_1012p8 [Vanderwaltozyma polyspora DSM 70294]|uniref:Ribosome biogenesis protein NOP53 n=1 Tax=Vanderwaltozyma polyspora (strain ATCC 22028 / DSM 70294 / BCRC 21397 / CBS 2163 / NBRC 10782 / NRRL Y-8283 / UCD 57-17) TaxID=436907 RepID=A7TS81_VANPO|nr:uncharacterized protein Kpol_1012p8 [Vanderwaltozyma polyspora DSM 70294]EDO14880.1 hypothetical protein Kpol_1012p8 [Vanderwaltozyma polyspora DSM 70294]